MMVTIALPRSKQLLVVAAKQRMFDVLLFRNCGPVQHSEAMVVVLLPHRRSAI